MDSKTLNKPFIGRWMLKWTDLRLHTPMFQPQGCLVACFGCNVAALAKHSEFDTIIWQ